MVALVENAPMIAPSLLKFSWQQLFVLDLGSKSFVPSVHPDSGMLQKMAEDNEWEVTETEGLPTEPHAINPPTHGTKQS
jgi:hypothetical protein